MARFLTTRGASYEIENIISTAKNSLVLISPYIKIPEPLLQSLKDAAKRKVKITLVYGKGKLKPDVVSQLEQLDNLSLYFLNNLHAKCFLNEECMVITSLNLLDSSEQNREMGVLISAKDDEDVFKGAVKEAKLIIGSSTKDELRRPKGKPYSYRTKQTGFCIRCKRKIPYNLDYPLCDECFEVWVQYGDLDYPEHYCHTCGKRASTSKARPECNSCYKPRG